MISFTTHAVERYMQFWSGDQRDPREATDVRAMLEEHAKYAVKMRDKTHRGHTKWQIEALGIEIVTKHDNGTDVCVTILPPVHLRGLDPITAEIVEARLREVTSQEKMLRVERAELQSAVKTDLPQPTKQGVTDLDGNTRTRTKLEQRLAEIRAEVSLRSEERQILAPLLKEMRLAERAHKATRALQVAMKYLKCLPPSDTKDVMHKIWLIDPDLARDQFVDQEPEEQDERRNGKKSSTGDRTAG